jgi:hypothetical protein
MTTMISLYPVISRLTFWCFSYYDYDYDYDDYDYDYDYYDYYR